MKKGQKLWTREELILAINLYFKIPFGRLHTSNPEVIQLAKLIGRTPGSVAYKLVNFASLDPTLKARGIKGAYNVSKQDKEIWDEFYNNWEVLPFESEKLLAMIKKTTLEKMHNIDESELPKEGKTREQIVKVRVNQSFFRKSVLAAYNNTCCITGIQQNELLIAGHIKPWKDDEKNRMNLSNGLCLNPLHDKAFDIGLITITPSYEIKLSSSLYKSSDSIAKEFLLQFNQKAINLPYKYLLDKKFLEYHNDKIFQP